MDITRILGKPHTAEQIGALWTAYHSKKSSEGKGFLSAAIPRATYESFLPAAKKYPSFILPLPRPDAQIESPKEGSTIDTPHEFYFMEWGHYSSPPPPNPDIEALFSTPRDFVASPNPPCTTVIFTPLQEYKLRQAYALPHLVLTHYTDLAHTHDVVLMRGELTPSSGGSQRFLLPPSAAQILAFGLQRFYLQGPESKQGKLLRTFHEKPEEFSWEELISASQI
jgi:ATP synthase mitochondrial F1 complex assembly factor 1